EIRIPASCLNCGAKFVQQTDSAVSGSGRRVTCMLRCSKCGRQEQVIVQAILRDGTSITSAGLAIVQGLDPGATAEVQGFFLGTGKGTLEVFAPSANGPDGAGAPSAEQAGDATVSMQ
ncbi:MAG: hypothetical protein JHD05_06430, partial [Thermoleophilia bacterium]|nr:hypothetical protein [Thermoleophilia bacterium]